MSQGRSAPGLVEQLQADAMDDSVPISNLLRKAKTAAVKLKQNDIADWIEHEMSGYHARADLPEYRKLHASLTFRNPLRGWCPVIGGEHEVQFGNSIAEIFALLEGGGSVVMGPVPVKVSKRVSQDAGFNVEVKRQISKAALAAILEAVRNVIHDWALNLERAGISGEGISFSQNEAERAQSVVVNIHSIGNATGIGAFGDNANIISNQSIDVKGLARQSIALANSLDNALPTSGLAEPVQAEVKKLLSEMRKAAKPTKPDESRLRKALTSLQTIMENTAGNLIASGVAAMVARILSGGH
jgi:AbiTii